MQDMYGDTIAKVRTVYGGTMYVLARHLNESGRVQLPRYNRKGERIGAHLHGRIGHGCRSTTIHRENIITP